MRPIVPSGSTYNLRSTELRGTSDREVVALRSVPTTDASDDFEIDVKSIARQFEPNKTRGEENRKEINISGDKSSQKNIKQEMNLLANVKSSVKRTDELLEDVNKDLKDLNNDTVINKTPVQNKISQGNKHIIKGNNTRPSTESTQQEIMREKSPETGHLSNNNDVPSVTKFKEILEMKEQSIKNTSDSKQELVKEKNKYGSAERKHHYKESTMKTDKIITQNETNTKYEESNNSHVNDEHNVETKNTSVEEKPTEDSTNNVEQNENKDYTEMDNQIVNKIIDVFKAENLDTISETQHEQNDIERKPTDSSALDNNTFSDRQIQILEKVIQAMKPTQDNEREKIKAEQLQEFAKIESNLEKVKLRCENCYYIDDYYILCDKLADLYKSADRIIAKDINIIVKKKSTLKKIRELEDGLEEAFQHLK